MSKERTATMVAAGLVAGLVLALVNPVAAASPIRKGAGGAIPSAAIDLDCGGGKVIKLTTGTNGGTCQTITTTNPPSAVCDDGPNESYANCNSGCETTKGSGTCSVAR